MKKWISLSLIAILLVSLCLTGCGGKKGLTLNVYNWGEYISDGSEGSFDTVREFEKWYQETYGQKVSDQNIVTANGSATLEFAKELLLLLENDTPERIEMYYQFNKQGFCI